MIEAKQDRTSDEKEGASNQAIKERFIGKGTGDLSSRLRTSPAGTINSFNWQ